MPEQFPGIPEPLLKFLNNLYPERSPDATLTSRQIWIEVGKREVVRYLNMQFEKQAQASLKGQKNV